VELCAKIQSQSTVLTLILTNGFDDPDLYRKVVDMEHWHLDCLQVTVFFLAESLPVIGFKLEKKSIVKF
jgi:hypothetical protein